MYNLANYELLFSEKSRPNVYLSEKGVLTMLWLVATPIGNLGDMGQRAVAVLQGVDLIASEDTRKTSILLKHYAISKPQLALNEFNERKVVPQLVGRLEAGETIALVTDAGTPGISDPGYLLVRAALDAGVEISAVPGPSAVIMALTLSGLPMHAFTFRGFPPNKEGPRKRFLDQDKLLPYTLVYYESPYRLQAFIKTAIEVLGDRQASIANDLTKKFETVLRGSLTELQETLLNARIQGEYTVCIAGFDLKAKTLKD